MLPKDTERWMLVTFLIWLLLTDSGAIEWLAIVKRKDPQSWNRTSDCLDTTTFGLSTRQRAVCRRNRALMPVVLLAARQTALVCQQMFFDSRWNCSSINYAPAFRNDLNGGSREQSVVYAIASVSLAHAIARDCAVGNNGKCSCGRVPRTDSATSDFRWGGCSDNVQFGIFFSRLFIDSPSKGTENEAGQQQQQRSKRTLVNLHNSQVGRKKLLTSVTRTCKCHGVSGSCSVKTCWNTVTDLRAIGSELMKSYYVAVEVGVTVQDKVTTRAGTVSRTGTVTNATKLLPVLRGKKHFTEDDLIYYTKSSDFCLPDRSLGSPGTRDRECSKDDPGSIGCRSMCCGRGYTSHVIERTYRCDCKYYWCCYVKCKTCSKTVQIHRCR